jgi:hypothetical protein
LQKETRRRVFRIVIQTYSGGFCRIEAAGYP